MPGCRIAHRRLVRLESQYRHLMPQSRLEMARSAALARITDEDLAMLLELCRLEKCGSSEHIGPEEQGALDRYNVALTSAASSFRLTRDETAEVLGKKPHRKPT